MKKLAEPLLRQNKNRANCHLADLNIVKVGGMLFLLLVNSSNFLVIFSLNGVFWLRLGICRSTVCIYWPDRRHR